MFINLTNHPSSGWSKEQLEAALEYGEIVDLPFPDIDEQATETEIKKLADEYVSAIKCKGNANNLTVHIMGEMTFTYAMVSRLKALGITCIASTTERLVKMMPDGKKISEFKFIQFREY